jgi:hypothetical protein
MSPTLTPTEIAARHRARAVRFFWCFLIGATVVSLIGNVVHAALPYIPHAVIQIGVAAVPPIALLAAVHGIALAVRAGASGRVYCWAVSAVAAIGLGAFAVSFPARDRLLSAARPTRRSRWSASESSLCRPLDGAVHPVAAGRETRLSEFRRTGAPTSPRGNRSGFSRRPNPS